MSKVSAFFLAIVGVAYLLSNFPQATGVPFHEWLGLAVVAALLVHAAVHSDWIMSALRAKSAKNRGIRILYVVLDVVTFVLLAVCLVSGLLVSGTVLPMAGLFADGYYFWDPLHAVAAKMLLAVVIIHVVLRVPAFMRAFRKRTPSAA